jgi:hypothetical protein
MKKPVVLENKTSYYLDVLTPYPPSKGSHTLRKMVTQSRELAFEIRKLLMKKRGVIVNIEKIVDTRMRHRIMLRRTSAKIKIVRHRRTF